MPLKDVEKKPLRGGALRELAVEELQQELARLEEERYRLGFRSGTESIENPIQFRMLRRNIARIKTVLKEKARG
ncbi:MAG TPA: 50S ribosomal protein L29 [Ramlibacter sp.]|nr:50S ribosomal protein L29 [Ramlibacter sp.]